MKCAQWGALLSVVTACGPTRIDTANSLANETLRPSELQSSHALTLAITRDDQWLFVVRPDEDAVAKVSTRSLRVERMIALAPTPTVDAAGRYTPSVSPRSLALSEDETRVAIAGERAGEVIVLDAHTGVITMRKRVCARPISVAWASAVQGLIVTCAADDRVLLLDDRTLSERASVRVQALPWGLWVDALTQRAHVTHLHGPGTTTLDWSPFSLMIRSEDRISDVAPRGHRTLAHGRVRSMYDLAWSPTQRALWVAHELHGDDTAQPELDFESTVFAAVTVREGARSETLTVDSRLAGVDGAMGDVVSGPRSLTLSRDGRWLFVVAQASEDVLVMDTERRVQAGLLRPLAGHWPQAIVLSQDNTRAFVDLRNSGTITQLALRYEPSGTVSARVLGAPIDARGTDPMPSEMRLGQRVFVTANDTDIPVTTNRWMACASCHPEGTTNRITWKFSQGPRDTPSNAGGPDGFLFRTADRRDLREYWQTIVVEQGGHFAADDQILAPYLDAVASYVQSAIPTPPAPTLDPAQIARGRAVFDRTDTQCRRCHDGPSLTDSGRNNPTLNLSGPVQLWDVGICSPEDRAHQDMAGHPRAACRLDTPALRGLHDSAPYLHDGRAGTLREVLTTHNRRDQHGVTSHLSAHELDDLVVFLQSL
ncbi:MAG: hypothetical protein Q8Q09_01330 [Deltaproteobacteria bacterium]|nr:hypothetical protein [Deltaproteobacteria bacterium]